MIIDGAMGTMIQVRFMCGKRRGLLHSAFKWCLVQKRKLSEEDYRGERFAHFTHDVKGNNDMLSLTQVRRRRLTSRRKFRLPHVCTGSHVQPRVIEEIHLEYLRAGADIVETNTFSGTKIAQADYAMEEYVFEINKVREPGVSSALRFASRQL